MKKLLLPIIIIIFLSACAKREVSQKETYYIVKNQNTDLFKSPSTQSQVVKRLEINVKLTGVVQDNWLYVNDSLNTGYIRMVNLALKEEYIKVNVFQGNELQLAIDSFLYNKIKITEWTFWILLIVLPLLAILSVFFISSSLEAKFVKEINGDLRTAFNVTPIYIAILVTLQSVLLYFYYVESIKYITQPSWLPLEGDWIQWAWTISFYLFGLILLSDLISGFKNYGFSNGLLRFVLGLITVVLTAAAVFILSWTLIAIAILILIVGLIALIAGGLGSTDQNKSSKPDKFKNLTDKIAKQREEEIKKNAEREFFERSQKQYRD